MVSALLGIHLSENLIVLPRKICDHFFSSLLCVTDLGATFIFFIEGLNTGLLFRIDSNPWLFQIMRNYFENKSKIKHILTFVLLSIVPRQIDYRYEECVQFDCFGSLSWNNHTCNKGIKMGKPSPEKRPCPVSIPIDKQTGQDAFPTF